MVRGVMFEGGGHEEGARNIPFGLMSITLASSLRRHSPSGTHDSVSFSTRTFQ